MSITEPVAIETHYAGHRFRSRLEARWAVFFDRLGIPWAYEVQGYVLDGTPYLPDFEVDFGIRSGERVLVEVKGRPDELDRDLIATAATKLRRNFLILGPVPTVELGQTGVLHWSVGYDPDTTWQEVAFGYGGGVEMRCAPYQSGWSSRQPPPAADVFGRAVVHVNSPQRVLAAYDIARTARFEHGETPSAGE
ncbi:MAG TPA: hypothetical protein VFM55_19230 [Micromonosporaceae bacterium]|nr:hypothetical protein [Micromonosporaceae bacterium]